MEGTGPDTILGGSAVVDILLIDTVVPVVGLAEGDGESLINTVLAVGPMEGKSGSLTDTAVLFLQSLCFIYPPPYCLGSFLLFLFKCLQDRFIVCIWTPDLIRSSQNMMDLAVRCFITGGP